MGGCAGINCTNSSKKGYRMFRFPTTQLRRKQWILNTRRHNWNPGNGAQLCEDHFDDSQFELKRADGWKRLKQDAVPTLIKVPSSHLLLAIKGANIIKEALSQNKDHFDTSQFELNRADSWKKLKQDAVPTVTKMPSPPLIIAIKRENIIEKALSQNKKSQLGVNTSAEEHLLEKIIELEKENKRLKEELEVKNQSLSFLSEEQIEMASKNRNSIAYLTNESIMECMKLRFALGKFG